MRPDAIIPWLILFLPLLAAGGIVLFTLRNPRLSATLSIGAVLAGFALTLAFLALHGWAPLELSAPWLSVGNLQADFGIRIDSLSLMMLLIVTGVGGAIHVYSAGYMHDDPGYARYFACLSLFTFSMLGIVLSANFLQMFIFWELVGVSSYLLIGFWFGKPSAADAAKKAFITNRLGDFGFLLGILVVFTTLGALNFTALQEKIAANPAALGTAATLAGLLIFCGAVGKSAQFPLHVWLPDAMEGPTPVSALIHAATMVAAGVYMLCRVIFLFDAQALQVIAWIGGFTALLSALIAIQQDDIKRILAYSTLSQLGYMVMSVGMSAPSAAMYHLTTHAFFKALLFLAAGSVIHGLHGEQDIWKMGDLRSRMRVTTWTFLFGALALSGVPPFSGFYSKDSILGHAFAQHHYGLFALGAFVAALTAFYVLRLFHVAFLGSARTDAARHAHESPPVMTWPLRGLALLSLAGGFLGIQAVYQSVFASEPAAEHALTFLQKLTEPFVESPVGTAISLSAVILGLIAAHLAYSKTRVDPLPARLGALSRAMRDRFYFDELYEATFIRGHDFIAAVADWFDRWIIAGLGVRGIHGTTELAGRALRLFQTGNLQGYALLLVLGTAVLIWWVLGK
ncbi:MAG: NADH-quinone oxidoreductase subunit L [Verrucomicrobiota bacterium]